MEIQNGAVMQANGLELETGFSTSADIAEMDARLNFVGGYKWEMGDVNAFYVKKQLLSNQRVNGKRVPYKGSVTEAGKALLLQEGMKEEEITPQVLFARFNGDTDIQALVDYVRTVQVVVDGKKMGRRVLSPRIVDPDTKKRIPTAIDKLAKLTGDIHNILRTEQENKLKAGGVGKDIIEKTLQTFDQEKKLIKATKTRVAMEICYFPVDKVTFQYEQDKYTGLTGVIYTCNTEIYGLIKGKLHTADDKHLDYLEIKMSHPVSNKYGNNKDMNKMDSAQKPGVGSFDDKTSPALQIENFDEAYLAYCKTSIQTAEDLRQKIFDFQPISEEEAISLCKDYVLQNGNILDDEAKKNNAEILKRFQETLSAEEIATISNMFSNMPGVQEAEGYITENAGSNPQQANTSQPTQDTQTTQSAQATAQQQSTQPTQPSQSTNAGFGGGTFGGGNFVGATGFVEGGAGGFQMETNN